MKLSILLDTVWSVDGVGKPAQCLSRGGSPSYLCSVARCCDAALGHKLYYVVVT